MAAFATRRAARCVRCPPTSLGPFSETPSTTEDSRLFQLTLSLNVEFMGGLGMRTLADDPISKVKLVFTGLAQNSQVGPAV